MRRYVLRSTKSARNPNDPPSSAPPPPPPPSNNSTIRTHLAYMECQRNIAERIGGHAYDGCREFLATGAEGTPGALICAACQCNRSFHKAVIHTHVVFNDDNAPPSAAAAPPARGGVTA